MDGGGRGDGAYYTLSDISNHNSNNDCWLLISGIVYDVSKFMGDHPGGEDVLLAATGKDATSDFEDVGHSTTGKTMMEEFRIGILDSSTLPEDKNSMEQQKQPITTASITNHSPEDKKNPTLFIKIMQFLLPLIIIGMAICVRIYTKVA